MIIVHLAAFLAALATGIALPLRLEVTVTLFVAVGLTSILLQDYSRQPRTLRTPTRVRVLRPRAHFRPLPLAFATEPRGIEIRPIIQRLRESNRLAA
jgi:hypothetical protein